MLHPLRLAIPLAALALSACADRIAAPELVPAPPPEVLQALACTADVRGRSLDCDPQGPSTGSVRGSIIGGQGTNVRLASTNVAYDSAARVFRMDATITNLMEGTTIGTYDGEGIAGVRVFFHSAPVATGGAGEVAIANHDGEQVFMAPGEAFYNYAAMIPAGSTTPARQWRFSVPAGVERFAFTVYLEAPVFDNRPHPPTYGQFRQMAAGFSHSCGLTIEGDIFCWGNGGDGRLGHGTDRTFLDPVKVAGDVEWRSVTAGYEHTCALTTASEPRCWGKGAAAGGGLETADSLDAGGNSTCALRAGTAYCWGDNEWGQLGTGDRETRTAATPVTGGHAFVDVRVGAMHACGLEADGEVWCWGMNQHGALGTAAAAETCGTSFPYPCSTTPLRVETETRFARIDAGAAHTCGITAAGVAWCWGNNALGQLGTGSAQDGNPVPAPVVTNGVFRHIVAMDRTTCGIAEGGLADCWGTNPGSVTQNVDDVVGDLHWRSLAGAHEHICGATNDGQGFCTGREQFGELGNLGTHQNQGTTPIPLAPLHLVDQPPIAGMECSTGGYAEAVCSARVDHLGRQFSTYSYDDYGVVSRIWSWGDGSPEEEGEWVRHSYTKNGTYVITLTVFDAAGQRSMKQETVVVNNLAAAQ